MRGVTRVMRVAATISDLDNQPVIRQHAVSEALSYRQIAYDIPRVTA
jgi:predicted ATPase with chaperone activity